MKFLYKIQFQFKVIFSLGNRIFQFKSQTSKELKLYEELRTLGMKNFLFKAIISRA